MRTARPVLIVAILFGLLWVGQGVGLIPGSFMTGRVEWAVIGGVVAGLSALSLWWLYR